MASTLLLWIHLLLLFRHCVHPGLRRNRHRGTSFVVHRQQAWRRSCRARLRSQFNSVLLFPPFQELAHSIRTPQRFWAATRDRGIWEKDVCFLWNTMGRSILTGKMHSTELSQDGGPDVDKLSFSVRIPPRYRFLALGRHRSLLRLRRSEKTPTTTVAVKIAVASIVTSGPRSRYETCSVTDKTSPCRRRHFCRSVTGA